MGDQSVETPYTFAMHNFPSHGRVMHFLRAEELASLISTVPTDAPVSHVEHL